MDNEKLIKKTRKLLVKWGVTDAEADEFIKELAQASTDDFKDDVDDPDEISAQDETTELPETPVEDKPTEEPVDEEPVEPNEPIEEAPTDEPTEPTEPTDEPPVEPETPPVESVTMEAFNELVKRVEELEKTNGKTVKEVEPKEASELDKAIAQYSN